MKLELDLQNQKVTGPYTGEKPLASTTKQSLADFIDKMATSAKFSTGLLPLTGSGILSIQRAFGHEQIVIQKEPCVEKVRWGTSEGQRDKPIFDLAMPYRVFVVDYLNGNLLGARHYWSLEPIYSLEQPLYCVALPNTNTTGYRGNSVGWICLYHTADTTKMTFSERVEYALMRVHGVSEPYNDANMSSTDGPRFYNKQVPGHIFSDPKKWAAKSAKEGWQWVMDKELLIAMTTAAPSKDNHNDKWVSPTAGGVPYTVGRAINEQYQAYYHDQQFVKHFMPKTKDLPQGVLMSMFMGGGAAPAAVPAKPVIAETGADMRAYFAKNNNSQIRLSPALSKRLAGRPKQMCKNCGVKHFKDTMQEVAYSVDGPNRDFTMQMWCKDCVKTYSAAVIGFTFRMHLGLTSKTKVGAHLYKYDAMSCYNCGDVLPKANKDDHQVYRRDYYPDDPTQYDNTRIGCRSCYAYFNQVVAREYKTNKMYDKNAMVSHKLKQLQTTPSGLAVVETEVWMFTQDLPCACGIFTDTSNEQKMLDGKKTCAECITDGKYCPSVSLLETPPTVTTAQLATK